MTLSRAARWRDRRQARRERNESALKSLKTNNPAKLPDFAPNDFNGLRLRKRSLWFRSAKDPFRPDGRKRRGAPIPRSLRLSGCAAWLAGA
jgi:hypothetical protein